MFFKKNHLSLKWHPIQEFSLKIEKIDYKYYTNVLHTTLYPCAGHCLSKLSAIFNIFMLKVTIFLYYSCQPFWPLELCQLDNIGRNCGSTSMSGGDETQSVSFL